MAPALLQFPLGADVFGTYDPQTYMVGVNAEADTPSGDCTVLATGVALVASGGTLSASVRGQQLGVRPHWWVRLRKQWRPAQRKLIAAPVLHEPFTVQDRTVLPSGSSLNLTLGTPLHGNLPSLTGTESGLRVPHWVRRALQWRPAQRRLVASGILHTLVADRTVSANGLGFDSALGTASTSSVEYGTVVVEGLGLSTATGTATTNIAGTRTLIPQGVSFEALRGQAVVTTATTRVTSSFALQLPLRSVLPSIQQGLTVQVSGQTVLSLLGTIGSRATGRVELVAGSTFAITSHVTRVLATVTSTAGATLTLAPLAVRTGQLSARAGATLALSARRQLIASTQMRAGASMLIAIPRASRTISLYGPFDADQQFGEGE